MNMASRFTKIAKKVLDHDRENPYDPMTDKKVLNHARENSYNPMIDNASIKLTNQQENNAIEQTDSSLNPDMASVALKIHVVNKAKGILKEKAKVKLRLKLKERMRQLAEERLTVKQIFTRYVESSTLHGFRYTCTNTYLVRRVIWTLLMVGGAIYFINKLHDGLIRYYEYPFSTKSTLEYSDRLTFPAISFCPLNQFKRSDVRNSTLNVLYRDNRLPINSNWSDPGYDIHGETLVHDLKRSSFSVYDLHQECDWISRDTDHPDVDPNYCGTENFTSYFSEEGNLCFTLNSGNIEHKRLEVDHSGLNNGYQLLFDLKTNEAIQQQQFSGLQVIIHDPTEPPVTSTGFVISPGFKTFVQLETMEIVNLPPPYSTKCGHRTLKYFKEYSQTSCILELLTNYTAQICECRELFMPDNSLPYCSLRKMTVCMLPAKESFNEYEMRSKCPIDCQQTLYETTLSNSRFLHHPPKGIEPVLMKGALARKNLTYSHILHLRDKYNNTEFDAYLEDNIINVIFFYAEMSKVITKQAATYTFYKFLGDIGGTFGLMLGASLLTFFEFIDLIMFFLYHQLLRFQKQHEIEKEEKRKTMLLELENRNTYPLLPTTE